MLRTSGYRTAMLGKWHLGAADAAWPTAHGFGSFWGVPYSNDMNPSPLYRDRTVIAATTGQTRFAADMANEARAVFSAASDKPFFLDVAAIVPHVPLRPGPAFRGKSAAGLYGDAVEELDWTVGEILKAVRKAGKDRDTIIIFTSANGPWWEGSAADRRGAKGGTLEGGYAVPLLARWPGHIRPGNHSAGIAMNIDLLPTLATIAGAPLPPGLDGKDIASLFAGCAQSPHESLLFFANADIAAIRTQDWRMLLSAYYLTYSAPLDKAGYQLLFDTRTDPGERYSVADRHPDVVARFQASVDAARAEFAAIPQQKTDPVVRLPAVLPNSPAPPAR